MGTRVCPGTLCPRHSANHPARTNQTLNRYYNSHGVNDSVRPDVHTSSRPGLSLPCCRSPSGRTANINRYLPPLDQTRLIYTCVVLHELFSRARAREREQARSVAAIPIFAMRDAMFQMRSGKCETQGGIALNNGRDTQIAKTPLEISNENSFGNAHPPARKLVESIAQYNLHNRKQKYDTCNGESASDMAIVVGSAARRSTQASASSTRARLGSAVPGQGAAAGILLRQFHTDARRRRISDPKRPSSRRPLPRDVHLSTPCNSPAQVRYCLQKEANVINTGTSLCSILTHRCL